MPVIKIALPKGDTQDAVRDFLTSRGLVFEGYDKEARAYTASASGSQAVFSKQFREKDIPIQVSISNYDLGLCASQWVEEYLSLYPEAEILKISALDISDGNLCVLCAAGEPGNSPEATLKAIAARGPVRIATQFPGLAENYALSRKIPNFRVFPLWGAAEAYPPEGAELAIMTVSDSGFPALNGLRVIESLFSGRTLLIANSRTFREKDLSPILGSLA